LFEEFPVIFEKSSKMRDEPPNAAIPIRQKQLQPIFQLQGGHVQVPKPAIEYPRLNWSSAHDGIVIKGGISQYH
jgi:hypothetical protein